MYYSKITNIEFDGIGGHPKHENAFIKSADINGEPMTEEQLDEINDNSDFVHMELIKYLN